MRRDEGASGPATSLQRRPAATAGRLAALENTPPPRYRPAMQWLGVAFAAMATFAGGYYLLNSRAAEKLAGVEEAGANRLRVRLRRLNGLCMVLLGFLFLVACWATEPDRPALVFLATWLAVLVLLALIVVLAIADLRLTWRLRRRP